MFALKGERMEDKLQIHMVKTDKGCFITDCTAISGYDWNYHQSKLENMFFDGEKPEPTFFANWVKIKKYPKTIQKLQTVPSINKRYELKDKELESNKLPLIIKHENMENENILSLYEYKEDMQNAILVDVDCDIQIIMEVENFEVPPVINYKAIKRDSFSDKVFNITNKNIQHQLFDKIIFPEVMLHTRPCSISSQQLYCLVRQHIKENIDTKVARITSDYDFCFAVKKIIPLIEPQTVSYQNILARTKKERSKIVTKTFKEIEIFEMTHDQIKYNNYTVINPIFANNETELKNKIDEFLNNLMEIINKPLQMCDKCGGSGYIEEIDKRIKRLDKISN
jgi:hypothetical protein